MSLSPIKQEILETMLLYDKPARAAQIAKEARKEFKPVMMHILGLTRVGYVYSPEKGQYAITEEGKKALGLPKTTKEAAQAIMAQPPSNGAFHFYSDIGKPLDLHASSLNEFSGIILKVDEDSVDFHLNRGDFEAWFAGIGDLELAKKAALLKEKKITGIELCTKLREIVENRCIALTILSHQTDQST
jgi:hypothetical protein